MKCTVARRRTGRREHVALLSAAIVALGVTPAFATVSANARSEHSAAKPTVKVATTYDGPLLVDKSGYTIYMFVRDKRNKDKCRKIKGCEKKWPAVTTTGKPVAGPGVKKSLLGTIPYKGKLRELTYKGHPLHTYSVERRDGSKRDVLNIGIRQYGGAWYALNAKGTVVK